MKIREAPPLNREENSRYKDWFFENPPRYRRLCRAIRTQKVFEQAFGMSIPYYVRVDFTAFKELVDAIGGITINVQRSFVDTAYPGPNDSFQTVSFEAGLQQINGERALIFARSRHGSNGEGSDFARAKRQQLVLAAFKKKILSAGTYLNPITLQKIFTSLSQHIITNFDFGQTMYLVSLAKEINSDEIKTLVIDDSPNGFLKSIIGEDGAYLLVPKSGNFSEINSAINNIFEAPGTVTVYTPEQNKPAPTIAIVPSVKIEIQNGTWQPGLAAIKAVVYPKETDYWYYLHDPEGRVHFARTIEEHERNIATYLQ